MPSPKKLDLTAKFKDASETQKEGLNQRIQELQAEITRLRSEGEQEKERLQEALNNLAGNLAEGGGTQRVKLSLIDPNPDQPRKIFPQANLEAFGVRLQEDGQQVPIILIPQDERYFLFDGERRWRTAQLLGWDDIEAVFLNQDLPDRTTLRKRVLATTRDRDDLHALDLADCIIEEILESWPQLDQSFIPKFLQAGLKRLERAGTYSDLASVVNMSAEEQEAWVSNADLTEEQQWVLGGILRLRYHPANINRNVFSLLALPEDLKAMIRETGLDPGKAKRVGRLTSKNLNCSEGKAVALRNNIATKVVQEGLSDRDTDSLVKQILQEYQSQDNSATSHSSKPRQVKLVETLSIANASADELEMLQEALKKKLEEIQRAIAETSGN